MSDVKIAWKDRNYGESGQRVYRGTAPLDPQSLPVPVADLGPGVTQYLDENLTAGETYYYRLGAYFPDGSEYVSDEYAITLVGVVYLLDGYAAAAAAYSVRRLATAHTGAALRVRRSSDNAEQDIGFAGEDLDTAALLAFCGGGSGYVVTWYDQSGNGRDVALGTAGQQPEIVSAGSVRVEGGHPALWSRVTKGFATGVPGTTTKTMLVVGNIDRLDNNNSSPARVLSGYDGSGSIDNDMLWDRYSGNLRYFDGGKTITISGGSGRKLFSAYRNAVEIGASVNGGATTTAGVPNGIANPYGPRLYEDAVNDTNNETPKNYQEVVIFTSDRTGDLAALKANINAYFALY